ncbi:MAG: PIG-L family deacetylase [Desulfobacteraceae bacterium]|nr:PIG-L family deacetylase [Desulfobacteraceae bacterium]
MNILAVGAHPDDIEIGCGGTLIKYARKGHNIFLLLITKGEKGGDIETREVEQVKAAEIVGVKDIYWGDYQDTELLHKGREIIQTVENHIKIVKPDLIFVNFSDDTHQDHRRVTQSVLSATRYVKNVLFYEVPTTSNFVPHVFVDISETLEEKIRALEAHQSQVMKTNIEDLSIVEIARSAATFRGIQGRVKYAEAFSALRLFLDI